MKNKKRRRNLNWSAGAPLGAGRSPTDELGRKRRMTQFILRPRSVHFMCILFNLFTVK